MKIELLHSNKKLINKKFQSNVKLSNFKELINILEILALTLH
jgi:hypothetical protein